MSLGRRLRAIGELLGFLRRRRNWTLLLVITLLLLLSLLIILTEGSSLAPFIYPLF